MTYLNRVVTMANGRWLIICLILVRVFGLPTSSLIAGDEPRADLQKIVAGIDRISPELSGLQVAVIENGNLTYSAALGMARLDKDGTAIPLAPHHKVRVASISKLVLAIGLMQLVEDGKVGLKDDINQYFDFPIRNPAYPATPILVEQLLSHTSSIRDGGQYWLAYGEDFSSFFLPTGDHYENGAHFAGGIDEADTAQDQSPGAFFTYSNLNFGILAAIMERASGQRFDVYMRANVLKPMGLKAGYSPCDITNNDADTLTTLFRRNDTDGTWQPEGPWRAQVDGEMVTCYYGMTPTERDQTPPFPYFTDYDLGSNPTLFSPQGGLRASAEDLATIMIMLMNKGRHQEVQILAAASVDAMLETRWALNAGKTNGFTTEGVKQDDSFSGLMTAYGLSVHIADFAAWGLTSKRISLYGHLGEAYGLLGQFWFDPISNSGLVALITGTADNPDAFPAVSSPLYRPEEEIARWWITHFLGQQ